MSLGITIIDQHTYTVELFLDYIKSNEIKSEYIDIEEIKHELSNEFLWTYTVDDEEQYISPRDFLNLYQEGKYPIDCDQDHYKRILSADLRYPIILNLIEGQYYILDGAHRLVKAVTNGHKKIRAYVFEGELPTPEEMVK